MAMRKKEQKVCRAAMWAVVLLGALLAACASSGTVARIDEPPTSAPSTMAADDQRTVGRPRVSVVSPDVCEADGRGLSGQATEEDNIALLLGPEGYSKFDIPIVFNEAVQYNIRWFQEEKRKVFANWLRRSRRYVPLITGLLRQQGMPEDLVYLAMIESGFNPRAYSTAKACGPWQFIYATGERYGLKVNYWIDERRDPEKSTVAAAKYLRDLFNQFGCWYLAAAGYNAGEKRVERAIERHKTNDYWELVRYNALPKETREYIPRLIAAAIIAKDPEKFGFDGIKYDMPIPYQKVTVPGGVSIISVSRAAEVNPDDVRFLNPELLRGITPPDMPEYTIKVPGPVAPGFAGTLALWLEKERRVKDISAYKVKKNDSIDGIMKKYRIDYGEFCLVNECGDGVRITRGMTVNIPRFAKVAPKKDGAAVGVAKAEKSTGAKTAKGKGVEERVAKAPAVREKQASGKDRRVTVAAAGVTEREAEAPQNVTGKAGPAVHVVKRGENLASIADRYGVDVATLKSVNNLKGDTVHPNTRLRLAAYQKGKQESPAKVHVVRKGESLKSIAAKYRTTVAALKAGNGLQKEEIRPGMKVKVVRADGPYANTAQ
jgi:membrane-bound lytic murein transglycosylase D